MIPAHGSLLGSLGWMASVLGPLIREHPGAGTALLLASRAHLHALALALTTEEPPADPELVAGILSEPLREGLRRLHLPEPRGMRRLLGRLPRAILEPESYRHAAALLAEDRAADVLRHGAAVSSALLANLTALPTRLRTPTVARSMTRNPCRAPSLMKWIGAVGARHPSGSPEVLLDLIGGGRSQRELRSRLRGFLDELPAHVEAPPPAVGHAVRLDTPSQMRAAGRRLRNCMTRPAEAWQQGEQWFYSWRCGAEEAACEVVRVEHMGWFLGDHLGPENRTLDDEVADRIRGEFEAAGMPSRAAVEAYYALRDGDCGSRSLRPRRR